MDGDTVEPPIKDPPRKGRPRKDTPPGPFTISINYFFDLRKDRQPPSKLKNRGCVPKVLHGGWGQKYSCGGMSATIINNYHGPFTQLMGIKSYT